MLYDCNFTPHNYSQIFKYSSNISSRWGFMWEKKGYILTLNEFLTGIQHLNMVWKKYHIEIKAQKSAFKNVLALTRSNMLQCDTFFYTFKKFFYQWLVTKSDSILVFGICARGTFYGKPHKYDKGKNNFPKSPWHKGVLLTYDEAYGEHTNQITADTSEVQVCLYLHCTTEQLNWLDLRGLQSTNTLTVARKYQKLINIILLM